MAAIDDLLHRCLVTRNAAPLACAVPSWFGAQLLSAMLLNSIHVAAVVSLVQSDLPGIFQSRAPGPFAVDEPARERMLELLGREFPDEYRTYHARAFAWFAGAYPNAAGQERALIAQEAMRLLQELFYLYIDHNRLDALAQTLEQAAAACFEEVNHAQTIRYYRAVLLNERHQYAEAESELTAVCAEAADRLLAARAYTALGMLYDYRQKFEAAIESYETSARLYRELGNQGGEARAINNLGIVYHELAEYEQAAGLFAQSYAIAKTLDDPVLTGRCLMELGYTDKQLGRWQAALDHYRQSLRIWEAANNEDYQARLHNNLGEVYLLTADWDSAGSHLRRAQNLYHAQPESDRNWRELADIVHNLALLDSALGAFDSAATHLQEALALAQRVADATAAARAHYGLGRLCRRTGDLTAAKAHYAQAILALETTGSQIDDPEVRASYRATQQRAYEEMVLLCLEEQQTAEALTFVEQAKASVLLDALSSEELPLEVTRQPTLTASEVQAGLPAATALVVYFATGRAGPAEAMLNHLPDKAADLRTLFLPSEGLLAFSVTRAHLTAIELGTTVKQIEAVHLQRLSGRLRGTTPVRGQPMSALTRWHALHRQLVEPLVAHLAGCRHVIFVPHGALHYLPLHALGEPGGLLQDRGLAVSYAPSASILFKTGFPHRRTHRRIRGAAAADKVVAAAHEPVRYLSVGVNLDGLLHAEAEAAWVAARLEAFEGEDPAAGTELLGAAATRTEVKRQLAAATFAHLACHGHFRHVAPMQSGLTMYDGLLTAGEILPLRLRAELVVLSACDTGLNKLTHGDELFGLTRAFLAAGVRSLLVTLWPVPDIAARLFMERFYSAWIEQGVPFSMAIAEAQLLLRTIEYDELRRQINHLGIAADEIEHLVATLRAMWPGERPFEHPYYWGGFVLTGNPG